VSIDDDIEKRLVDLEVKAAFAEDLVEQLNDVIVRQQAQIDQLARELRRLQGQLDSEQPAAARSLRDDLPPHY
jgi:SlyX protein